MLQRELDPSLIEEFDDSGDGKVTQLEYVLAMLRSLELVDMDFVAPILARFDELDKDGNGVLDRDDLQRLLLRRCDQIEALHSRPRQHLPALSPSSVAPRWFLGFCVQAPPHGPTSSCAHCVHQQPDGALLNCCVF